MKRMLIDAAHEDETRVVILDNDRVQDYDFVTSSKAQVKGNIYLAKITRVEPSLQAAFVEYGGGKQGFLPFSEIHPDYYQLPQDDKQKLLAEQIAEAEAEEAAEEEAFEREQAARESRNRNRGNRDDADEGFAEEDAYNNDEPSATAAEPFSSEPASIDAELMAALPDVESFTPPQPMLEVSNAAVLQSGEFAIHSDIVDVMPEDAAPGDAINTEGTIVDEQSQGTASEEGEEIRRGGRSETRGIHRRYHIQEVIKRNQIVLVQVIKEERGNKGCSLTTYISLAGRSAVLMPNSPKGGGISRKITDRETRRRLKEVASEMRTHRGMSVIIRTAGLDRTKAEIRRDYEYLVQVWNNVREQTLASTAPALIYEEGNLIKRSLRDLYSNDIQEVIVEGERAFEESKSFMKMLMPAHANRVKLFKDSMPLFSFAGVDEQLGGMTEPQVKLPSGGYIVINPTEALISIDVNSGRSTTERNVEETALKTNLEAAAEVARQLRLRDLAGLIVIDFIDMNYGKNRKAVERAMKDATKPDRAKIALGRISMFGLMELSRQRMRPSISESMGIICPHCRGTGYIHSVETIGIQIIRTLEKEAASGEYTMLRVTTQPEAALHVLNEKRELIQSLEQRYNVVVVIQIDDSIATGTYRLIKTTTEGKEVAHEDGKQPQRRGRRGKRGGTERPSVPNRKGGQLNFSEAVEENTDEPYVPEESENADDNEIIGGNRPQFVEEEGEEKSERPRRERGERSDRGERGERGGRNRNRRRGGRDRAERTEGEAPAIAAEGAETIEGTETAREPRTPREPREPRAEGDRSRRRGRRGGRNRNRERGDRGERPAGEQPQTGEAGNSIAASAPTGNEPREPREFAPRNAPASSYSSAEPVVTAKPQQPSRVIPLTEAQTTPPTSVPIISESGEPKEKRKGWWSRVLEN